MKWVTRERPVIDRIACPWLIARFIDKEPEFIFVPPREVKRVAAETGATPYDIPDVELTHVGEGCSFDTFMSKYSSSAIPPRHHREDRARRRHRSSRPHPAIGWACWRFRWAAGFVARRHQVLAHGSVIYDALYAWASKRKAETHSWPPKAIVT